MLGPEKVSTKRAADRKTGLIEGGGDQTGAEKGKPERRHIRLSRWGETSNTVMVLF